MIIIMTIAPVLHSFSKYGGRVFGTGKSEAANLASSFLRLSMPSTQFTILRKKGSEILKKM